MLCKFESRKCKLHHHCCSENDESAGGDAVLKEEESRTFFGVRFLGSMGVNVDRGE